MADEGAKRPSGPLDDTYPATRPPERASADTLLATTPPPRSSVPTLAPPPEQRYQLRGELGRGGMGRVVEAYDTHLDRTVALKEVLPRGGNIDRRFQREVKITARLEHASIVPLYDAGLLADGRPFYVMRRVSGRPLDEEIARATTLERRLALLPNVLAAIDAVAHAHKRGVIHRDLKPSNILVGELGETVVIDWGLAKVIGDGDEVHDSLEPRVPSAADSLQTQVGSVFGTPGFMAPEQARGDELGPQTDVYALGATLYQLLAGKPPIGGTSATEAIASTVLHRIQPIGRACPGAPVELATIVDKALAAEPGDRYPDAGALAEDVRRFLTGQLVGAHSYTPAQRLARFVRRHRAPLAVAALASVGIAALAWFSVHRIVTERDNAREASQEAREQREQADARAEELRRRADQLLLLHARSLLETSPTDAVAVLKQLEGRTTLLDEAHAIARAAVMRGVAYGLPTLPDYTTRLEMTADGRRLLQQNRDNKLQVLDLDARRVLRTFDAPQGSWSTWVGGDRLVLVISSQQAPSLFDPATGSVESLAVPVAQEVARTPDGMHLALRDRAGSVTLVDLPGKQVTTIAADPVADGIVIANDGAWIAASTEEGHGPERVLVTDRGGRILVTQEGRGTALAASAGGQLAMATASGVFVTRPGDAHPALTKLPIDPLESKFIHQLLFRDELLYIVSHRFIATWNGKTLWRDPRAPDGALVGSLTRGNVLAVLTTDGTLSLLDDSASAQLAPPARAPGMTRVATAAGSSRIAMTAADAILLWEASPLLPDVRRAPIAGTFTSETRVVQSAGFAPEWAWWDLDTRASDSQWMTTRPGIPEGSDDEGGRVMSVVSGGGATRAAIFDPSRKLETTIEPVVDRLVRLVPGDAVVYSPGHGQVLGKVGSEAARELIVLDGGVQSLSAYGPLGYAALGKRGELVRGRFDGSGFARATLPDIADNAVIVSGSKGEVWIANGDRLLEWTSTIREIARLPERIASIGSVPTGRLLVLANEDAYFVAAGATAPRRLVVGQHAQVSTNGERMVSVTGTGQIAVTELPSLVGWTIPRLHNAGNAFAISPSGHTIIQTIGGAAAIFRLPEPGSDFFAWLDELTNATHADDHLQWPWQTSR